jgi:molecular chaperone DnaK (HSP70)
MRAIGIDLGTTNSLAAAAGKEMKILPTRMGESITPSVVSYVKKRKAKEGEIVVGRQAVSHMARDPENTIFSIKRFMGAVYGDKHVQEAHKHINYKLAVAPSEEEMDQSIKVILGDKQYSSVDISAMILSQVRLDAEQALGESVTHAVITVPAYFHERQRAATQKAGQQAGLKVLKIIDEPTAAALFYGIGREDERHRVLVYDFGGGTFDISIIQMAGGQFQVLEIVGDQWLGGDDFDRTIIDRMIAWVRLEYDVDFSNDSIFLGRAKEVAEKVKIALGVQQSAEIDVPLLKVPGGGVIDIEMSLSREEFENDIAALVDKTVELMKTALQNQNFTPDDITEVLMVGGSTAIPLVHHAVCDFFGREKVKRHVNPMECVALGAAILADSYELTEDRTAVSTKEESLVEVTGMDLGIAAVRDGTLDAFVPIITKGTPYPLAEPKRKVFYPTEENQTLIRVPVYEGLNSLASLNEQAGVIEFPLPSGISTKTPVEVSFNFDRNRVLTVSVTVIGKDGLSVKETLHRDRPRVANQTKNRDDLREDWREDLQPSLRAGKHFLDTYGTYMDEEDRQELTEAIRQGQTALEEDNQTEGKRSTVLLTNKIMGSGVASQLFIAERAMHDTSPEITQNLAMAAAHIREAYSNNDQAMVKELSSKLRLLVAKIVRQRNSIQAVKDKQDLQNLLKVKE